MWIHNVFHVSQVKPVSSSPLIPPTVTPPAVRIIDGHQAYTISPIIDAHRCGQGYQFLVDWEGYGPEEQSCVSQSNVLDKDMIRDFKRQHPEKFGSLGSSR